MAGGVGATLGVRGDKSGPNKVRKLARSCAGKRGMLEEPKNGTDDRRAREPIAGEKTNFERRLTQENRVTRVD